MGKPLWTERFPEFSETDLSLEKLLETGQIPEDRFVNWASETYKVPALDSGFFEQASNFKLILENPYSEWKDSFFPVHEWQGVLYIACLEPRPLVLNKKHCYVLGSYKAMRKLWQKMEKPAAVKSAVVETFTEAQPEAGLDSFSQASVIIPLAEFEAKHAKPVEDSQVKAVPNASVAPIVEPSVEGGEKVDTEGFDFTHSQIKRDKPEREEKKASGDKPEMSVDSVSIRTKFPRKAGAAPEHTHTTTNTNSVTKNPFEESKSDVAMNPNFTASNFRIPEISNVFKIGAAKDMMTFTSTKTIMPFPDRTKDFTFIRTVYSEQVINEARSKIQDCKDPQEALISAFKVLSDYYKMLMWVVRDEKGRAFPIACNNQWSFSEDAWNIPMNFKTANPFRLCKFTQRPFHGPVSRSAVNDVYFQHWTNGKYPDIMTIVPTRLGGKVYGYFVGCEKGPHFHPQQTLDIMETVCRELTQTFSAIHKELTKAS